MHCERVMSSCVVSDRLCYGGAPVVFVLYRCHGEYQGLKVQTQFRAIIHLSGPHLFKVLLPSTAMKCSYLNNVAVGHSRTTLGDFENLRYFGFHSNHSPEGTGILYPPVFQYDLKPCRSLYYPPGQDNNRQPGSEDCSSCCRIHLERRQLGLCRDSQGDKQDKGVSGPAVGPGTPRAGPCYKAALAWKSRAGLHMWQSDIPTWWRDFSPTYYINVLQSQRWMKVLENTKHVVDAWLLEHCGKVSDCHLSSLTIYLACFRKFDCRVQFSSGCPCLSFGF